MLRISIYAVFHLHPFRFAEGPWSRQGDNMARRGLIAIFIVAVLLVASTAAAFVLLGSGSAITVTDDRGKDVILEKPPKKIVSLGTAFTEIIFDLGHKDDVVAVDYSSMWLVDGSDGIINLNQVSSLNAESILAVDADCVVIWNFNMYQDFIGSIEDAGIPVLAFYPKTVPEILSTINVLGTAIGEKDKAADLVAGMQERIDTVIAKVATVGDADKPKVYIELKTMGGRAAGDNTISNELTVMAGGINICADVSSTWAAPNEVIIERNPDIIVIEDGSTKTTAQLRLTLGTSVTAVANDGIYRIDDGMLSTGPRVVDALEDLAKWFHPELFD